MLSVTLLLSLAVAGCATRAFEDAGNCTAATRYIEAANTSRAVRVEALLHENVITVFLTGKPQAYSTIEGKAEVLDAIETYTQQCESCRSEAVCLYENDSSVYVIEYVRYVDQDGIEREQSSPLVIELEDGKIRRLIYYPSSPSEST